MGIADVDRMGLKLAKAAGAPPTAEAGGLPRLEAQRQVYLDVADAANTLSDALERLAAVRAGLVVDHDAARGRPRLRVIHGGGGAA